MANVGNTISKGGLNLFQSLTSLQEYGKFFINIDVIQRAFIFAFSRQHLSDKSALFV